MKENARDSYTNILITILLIIMISFFFYSPFKSKFIDKQEQIKAESLITPQGSLPQNNEEGYRDQRSYEETVQKPTIPKSDHDIQELYRNQLHAGMTFSDFIALTNNLVFTKRNDGSDLAVSKNGNMDKDWVRVKFNDEVFESRRENILINYLALYYGQEKSDEKTN